MPVEALKTRHPPIPTQVVIGAALCSLVGLLLARPPLGEKLQNLSYDAGFLAMPALKGSAPEYFTNVIILGFSTNAIPQRTNHVALLDRLAMDEARLVVFDMLFKAQKPEQDDLFAAAIRRNGRVLLATELEEEESSSGGTSLKGLRTKPLVQQIKQSALGIGSIHFPVGSDGRLRFQAEGTTAYPSLPVQAAKQLGASLGPTKANELWLNYYSEPAEIPLLEYAQALAQAPGYYRGKIIFVEEKDGDVHGTAF